jgi:chemotaxis protein methyltransferase CheR
MNQVIRELAQLIEASSGFVIADSNLGTLENFVRDRIASSAFAGIDRYLEFLRRHPESDEWRHLLSKITIKESYLFRALAQFEALAKVVLPEIAQRGHDPELKLWCAGCARGEEAATLAIVLANHEMVGGWPWRILATDVDDQALADARRGWYRERAVTRVPTEMLERHFSRGRDGYLLDPVLRARIDYRRLNLVEKPLDLGDQKFEIIFLRNVLIYFRPELQQRVIEQVEHSLVAGGFLFLAPSESLLHVATTLRARDLGQCFCYQSATESRPHVALGVDHPRSRIAGADTLARRPTAPAPTAPAFDERLESVLAAIERDDGDGARTGIDDLRRDFPESAIVHAVDGLASERRGNLERAAMAYRAALYLAPQMDELRFLHARTLEELGRTGAAAREYRTALNGLGSGSEEPAAVLERLGLPKLDQMIHMCRDFLVSYK